MISAPVLGTAAFAAHGVWRRFGADAAVAGVDLQVPHGSFLLLVGANGAGKTTLLHLWLDLLAPTEGEVRVFGMDPVCHGGAIRAQIGYVPETGEWPFPRMRLHRVLAQHAGYRVRWDHAYAERLCRALELKLDRRVGALSKGEFRRAQLVCALAHRPRALVLDEPTDGLDPLIRSRVIEILAAHLTESPATVIVSTHQVKEMDGLADRMAVLHRGRVVDAMDRDELCRSVRQFVFTSADEAPPEADIPARLARRERRGPEHRWTMVGNVDVTRRWLEAGGATIHEVRSLGIEEAAILLLEAADSARAG
ncbi:MAG: ABC transporter ATP-binding protein [Gemmatimonadales bacterium]|nr:ABC transporter ATP-binding protein [Gemmatimonadales bacterium]